MEDPKKHECFICPCKAEELAKYRRNTKLRTNEDVLKDKLKTLKEEIRLTYQQLREVSEDLRSFQDMAQKYANHEECGNG